ncbi:MAG: copper resistance protein CopC [Beijerinckiaceae bacterium]|nr:copper resistance protein CopC [Beijerinckiaceae bacterium]
MRLSIAAVLASVSVTDAAQSHALLDRAIPSVGGTVAGSPREIRLFFTQGVVTAFSHVHVVSEEGAVIPAGKPVNDRSDQSIVIVRLGRALKPGTYSVSWHVVSVDTHTTQGSFRFTVS